MNLPSVSPSQVRASLLLRDEIALLDVRHEAVFATGHPLFAAHMAAGRIELEAEARLPRKDVPIVIYDDGEGLVGVAADRLTALGYSNVRQLDGGLQGWKQAGFELFQDVNSYAKAFGELVEARRHTPSRAAEEVSALIADGANIQILDVRRFDEYATMNIPGSISVPGAELVLRAGRAAPDSETTIIVNSAGRTRSIIGTQSLINAGVTNKVRALRNGTIGWTLARQNLEHGSNRRGEIGTIAGGEASARDVAYRAGVRHIGRAEMTVLQAQADRTAPDGTMFEILLCQCPADGAVAQRHHLVGNTGINQRLGADDRAGAPRTIDDNRGFGIRRGAARTQHQLGARHADRARDIHGRVFVEPADVEDLNVGTISNQGADLLGGQRRRVPPRLHQFAERLGIGIDVLEQFVAGRSPALQPAVELPDIGVAQGFQALGRAAGQALAVIIDHDRHILARQSRLGFERDPVGRHVGGKQRVAGGEEGFVPDIEQRDFLTQQQCGADLRGSDRGYGHGRRFRKRHMIAGIVSMLGT